MAGIFISYRREDSAGHAGRLYDQLSAQFGAKNLFMDMDSIQPGDNFADLIDRRISSSKVLLAIIGPKWLTVTSTSGSQRLADPADFVRREIAAALNRQLRIVPVLVGGARMPLPQELPADVATLTKYEAIQLSDGDFHQDAGRLIEALRKSVPSSTTDRKAKTPKLTLRAEQGTFSADQVKAMLFTHGFFCVGWNEAGKGIQHAYDRQVLAGGLVVVDKATNLMWQKSGSPQGMPFDDAETYIASFNSSKFAGFADWRVPTLEEALSLMTPEKHGQYYRAPDFDGAPIMWTSDRHVNPGSAWILYFFDGRCSPESVNYNGYIRAVR